MIRANIETEIAPIVGNEKQAQDLVEYIKAESETPEGVWGTNIFGKSIEELVMDGMRNKITHDQRRKPGKTAGYHAENSQRQQRRTCLHYYIVIVSFFFTGKYDKINSK